MSYTYEKDGKELWLDEADPARRFDNMLYNKSYMTLIDQWARGRGFYQDPAGRVCNVVSAGRTIYIRDEETGECFSVNFSPVWRDCSSYRCGSGFNYQIIENVTDGLKVTWRIYVPAGEDPVEVWDLRVQDVSHTHRKVSVFTCVQMNCDGVDTYGGSLFRIARYEADINGIFVRTDAAPHEDMDFPIHNGFLAADRKPDGWDANLEKFIGSRRTAANPEAVEQGRCQARIASMATPTGTMHFRLQISAGGQEDLRLVIGACAQIDHAAALRSKYVRGSLDSDEHFDALAAERAAMMRNIRVSTGDESIDPMVNLWLKQQVHYGATWVRWGYKGYRDIVQQAQGVLTQDAALARKDLLAACAHQYADGFALRGWHPLDPLRYADCAQWLVSAVTEYVKETGDFALLEEVVPFVDGEGGARQAKGVQHMEGVSGGGEFQSAGAGGESAPPATVYEHLLRAMNRLHTDRGPHDLCLIFFGDWNDSLTGVCKKGRGESVWLSMAFCRCALLMQELAAYLGRKDDAARMAAWHAEMADAINRNAWDGQWYLCALDDDGNPIGSKENDEGKIFLNMQSWAQLGRVCDDERWATALVSTYQHLDSGWGLMLNWPTYTKPQSNIGRLSYLRPGACENGSVYTHGNAFLLLAMAERGMADAALKCWHDIHPGNPRRPVTLQPNVFFNGYDGPDSDNQPGMGGHAWTTGSASWMFFAMTDYILGLRRTYDGIVIRPCLPSAWKTASITRIYRGTTYKVALNNPAGRENPPVKKITIDGKAHPTDKPLPIDGKIHEVVVELG